MIKLIAILCPIILGPLKLVRKPECSSEKIDEAVRTFLNHFKARTGYEY